MALSASSSSNGERIDAFAALNYALVAVAMVVYFIFEQHSLMGDGGVRFDDLTALLRDGRVTSSKYSMLGPLISSPLWFLGEYVNSSAWWCGRFNVIYACFVLFGLQRALRKDLSPRELSGFLLLLVAGGLLPNHLRFYYSEVFSHGNIALGAVLLLQGRMLSGGALLSLATVNTPGTAIGVGLLCLWIALREQRPGALLIPIIAACGIVLEAWIRRGSPTTSGYTGDHGHVTFLPYSGEEGFAHPFWLGLFSILFSFGKGLLFFAPGVWLTHNALGRERRSLITRTMQAWLVFCVGLVLLYSKWWSWYGGWFFGPRFFLMIVFPTTLALVLRPTDGVPESLKRRLIFTVMILATVWVGIAGAIFDQDSVQHICTSANYAHESYCWYILELSVLVHPFIAGRTFNGDELVQLAFFGVAATALIGDRLSRPKTLN